MIQTNFRNKSDAFAMTLRPGKDGFPGYSLTLKNFCYTRVVLYITYVLINPMLLKKLKSTYPLEQIL